MGPKGAQALSALPRELGADLLAKAEAYLVDQAGHLGPRELRILGDRVLQYVAPEVADEIEYQQLLAAEHRAAAATRLTLRRRGDGATDLHARIPDLHAGMLRAYLNAFTNPRRRHQPDQQQPGPGAGEFTDLPLHRRQGIGFLALLERTLTSDLPRHGGRATTLVVTIDHHTLLGDLHRAGIATTSTGDLLTAGQARRLACQAGILPMVLAGKSVVLDQGRKKRCFDSHQRLALEVRDHTCTEVHCTVPAAFTEAHHPTPGPRAAAPTSTTADSSAASTTTAPTTPTGRPPTTPPAPPPSTGANSPPAHRTPMTR